MLQFLILVLCILLLWLRQRINLMDARLGDISARLIAVEGEIARQSVPTATRTAEPSPAPPKVARDVARPPSTGIPRTPPASPTERRPAARVVSPSDLIKPAPPKPAPSKAAPRTPTWIDAVRSWLFGGNTVVRVGVVVLFFGVAFFLSYAVEQGWFPIELRLISAALAGLGLLATGLTLRDSRREYALALQGGGLGIVYLTAFAAVSIYDLVGVAVGLSAMVALVVLGVVLAVTQDARSLAILASLGGFLGPVLVSRDASHVALFSYYAALDLGIVAVAWFRAWRLLNLLGFVFTFIVGAMWGFEFYQPEYFATTQPFLALFFLLFVAASVLFAWRQPPRLAGYVDGTLVFGVPLAAFALQHRLTTGFEYGPAWSALAASVFYALVAVALRRGGRDSMRLLVESFTALAVVFATLMVPLAVDGQWTSAAWALEGAALVWVGVRQGRSLALMSGVALQFLAGAVLLGDGPLTSGVIPVLNIMYLASLMVSLSGLFSGWFLYRHRDRHTTHPPLSVAALGWGTLWWFGGGASEIGRQLSFPDQHGATLVFMACSVAVIALLRHRLAWKHLAYPPLVLLPVMLLLTLTWLVRAAHPLEHWGAVGWPVSFLAQYWVLWRLESDWERPAPVYHCGALWLGVFFLCWESLWVIEQLIPSGPTWPFIVWALVPLGVVWGLTTFGRRLAWPVKRFADAYLGAGQIPLVVAAALWVLIANLHHGNPQPLGYIPFFNPVELAQGASIGVLLWWSFKARFTIDPENRWRGLGVLGFATLNGVIARATHFLGGVPFGIDALWSSGAFQTSLSIAWTTVACIVMAGATRLALRQLWWVGAALLAAVVIKLFSVDLADIGTIARIVSFIVVGALILIIGYVSPLPPKAPSSFDQDESRV